MPPECVVAAALGAVADVHCAVATALVAVAAVVGIQVHCRLN